jgi:hypothetical protein
MVPTSMQYTTHVLTPCFVHGCLTAETSTYRMKNPHSTLSDDTSSTLQVSISAGIDSDQVKGLYLLPIRLNAYTKQQLYKPCLNYWGHVIMDTSTDVYQLDAATTHYTCVVCSCLDAHFPSIRLGGVEQFPALHAQLTWHHVTYFFGVTLKLWCLRSQ